MSERFDYHALAPRAARALAGAMLDPRLKELVQLRISQINGCAFCIDMHWAALLELDVDPCHVNALAGWREAPRFFDARERAALQWAEAVNAVPHRVPSDAEFAEVRGWNALNASFHTPVPEVPYVAARQPG